MSYNTNHVILNPVPGNYTTPQTISVSFSNEVSYVVYSQENMPTISKYIAYDTLNPPNPFICVVEDGLGNVLFDGGSPKWYNTYCNTSWTDFSQMSGAYKYLYNALFYLSNPIKLSQGNRKVLVIGDRVDGQYQVNSTSDSSFKTSIDKVCQIANFTPHYTVISDYANSIIDTSYSTLDQYACVLIFSTAFTTSKLVTNNFIQNIVKYRENGNGIFIITDHGPEISFEQAQNGTTTPAYFTTANFIATQFGVWFAGSYDRTPVNVGFLRQNYGDHPLYNNLSNTEYIHAGASESRVFISASHDVYTDLSNFPQLQLNENGYKTFYFTYKLKNGRTCRDSFTYSLNVNNDTPSVSKIVRHLINTVKNSNKFISFNTLKHKVRLFKNNVSNNYNNLLNDTNAVTKQQLANESNLNIPYSAVTLNVPDIKIKSFSNDFLPVSLNINYEGNVPPFRSCNYYIFDTMYNKWYELRISSSNETGNISGGWNYLYLSKCYYGIIDNIDNLSTYRTTSIEYRPYFLSSDEFIDWIYDGNQDGFLCRIRNKQNANTIKHYIILVNHSGDFKNHTYIDVSDIVASYQLGTIQYFKQDKLFFAFKGSRQATFYVFDENKQLKTSIVGPDIHPNSSDVNVIYTEQTNAIIGVGYNHTHLHQLHIMKDYSSNKYYIARTLGIYMTNGIYHILYSYRDFIEYDVISNTLTDLNASNKPFNMYFPDSSRNGENIINGYHDYYHRIEKRYIINNRLVVLTHLNDSFSYNIYVYKYNFTPYQFCSEYINISNYIQLVTKKENVYPSDQSYIGKEFDKSRTVEFGNNILISSRAYSSKYGWKNVCIHTFNPNNPLNTVPTKIDIVQSDMLNCGTYINNQQVYKLISTVSNNLVEYTTLESFLNNTYTIVKSYAFNTSDLLTNLINNYSEDSHLTTTDRDIVVSPFTYNNMYFVKWFYKVPVQEGNTTKRHRMYLTAVDGNGNPIPGLNLKVFDSSQSETSDFQQRAQDNIYENDTNIYMCITVNLYRIVFICIVNYTKSNSSFSSVRNIDCDGIWHRQNTFLSKHYGLAYTKQFPYNYVNLYYSGDVNQTNFNQKMVDSIVSRGFNSISSIIQARGSTSFMIAWESFTLLNNGITVTISSSSIDLNTVTSDPKNKTFYIYLEIDTNNLQNTSFKAYLTQQTENENRIYVATCTTDNVGVSDITYSKRMFSILSKYLNTTQEQDKDNIPTVVDGKIHDNLMSPITNNIMVRSFDAIIAYNTFFPIDLQTTFGTTSYNTCICKVYVMDPQLNTYVNAELVSLVARTQDMRYVRIYNVGVQPSAQFRIIVEI